MTERTFNRGFRRHIRRLLGPIHGYTATMLLEFVLSAISAYKVSGAAYLNIGGISSTRRSGKVFSFPFQTRTGAVKCSSRCFGHYLLRLHLICDVSLYSRVSVTEPVDKLARNCQLPPH